MDVAAEGVESAVLTGKVGRQEWLSITIKPPQRHQHHGFGSWEPWIHTDFLVIGKTLLATSGEGQIPAIRLSRPV
jgi:hypothetical protein